LSDPETRKTHDLKRKTTSSSSSRSTHSSFRNSYSGFGRGPYAEEFFGPRGHTAPPKPKPQPPPKPKSKWSGPITVCQLC
jgi:hypothetical protein